MQNFIRAYTHAPPDKPNHTDSIWSGRKVKERIIDKDSREADKQG